MQVKEAEFEEIRISLSSMRLDSFVAKISKTSRGKAEEFLKENKVFVNARVQTKDTKAICKDDVIAIRGIGKFVIYEVFFDGKKNKNVLVVKKYK